MHHCSSDQYTKGSMHWFCEAPSCHWLDAPLAKWLKDSDIFASYFLHSELPLLLLLLLGDRFTEGLISGQMQRLRTPVPSSSSTQVLKVGMDSEFPCIGRCHGVHRCTTIQHFVFAIEKCILFCMHNIKQIHTQCPRAIKGGHVESLLSRAEQLLARLRYTHSWCCPHVLNFSVNLSEDEHQLTCDKALGRQAQPRIMMAIHWAPRHRMTRVVLINWLPVRFVPGRYNFLVNGAFDPKIKCTILSFVWSGSGGLIFLLPSCHLRRAFSSYMCVHFYCLK